MKKFLISILLGLALGMAYVGLLVVAFLPLILLLRSGILGLVGGTVDPTVFLRNVLGLNESIMYSLDVSSIIMMAMQLALYAAITVFTLLFIKKVLEIHLSQDGGDYFKKYYMVVFSILLIVPEIFIIISVFMKFPLYKSLFAIGGIVALVFVFGTVTAFRVLPDVIKNEGVKDIFENDN